MCCFDKTDFSIKLLNGSVPNDPTDALSKAKAEYELLQIIVKEATND